MQTLSDLSGSGLGHIFHSAMHLGGKSLLAQKLPLHSFTVFSFQSLNCSFSVVYSIFMNVWKQKEIQDLPCSPGDAGAVLITSSGETNTGVKTSNLSDKSARLDQIC